MSLFSENMQKRQQEQAKRLAELIAQAPSNNPTELAKYLTSNGVCDSSECIYRETIARTTGTITSIICKGKN